MEALPAGRGLEEAKGELKEAVSTGNVPGAEEKEEEEPSTGFALEEKDGELSACDAPEDGVVELASGKVLEEGVDSGLLVEDWDVATGASLVEDVPEEALDDSWLEDGRTEESLEAACVSDEDEP
ncbi:hypothetical protein CDD82_5583 [Ophiocordyceps australis]|uniref:Uncharacterized protein n=1 Tax=Ophiocordyceps australis TaxID=1399860 RepID=A0A2C5ZRX3_9HYPO|nr:hypothetical protein CDD82_5583 [Ophiocordyceps australis]